MSKLNQVKIPVTLDNLSEIVPLPETPNWKLVRERDGLTKQSAEVMWIEWDATGKFKVRHDNPDLGRSLLMSPFNDFFTWQCTPITGILEQREDYICFDTENSRYKLFKIKDNEKAIIDMMQQDEESGLYDENERNSSI
jgi:hypothetical protein